MVEKSKVFDGQSIEEGDFVAICGHELKAVGGELDEVCIQTVQKVLSERECEVITAFTGKAALQETVQRLEDHVAENYLYTELSVVETDDDFYYVVLSFE